MASRKLEVVITGDPSGASRAMRTVSDDADGMGSKMSKIGGTVAGVFGGTLLANAFSSFTSGVGSFIGGAFSAAEESAKIGRESARVIDSMGASSWTTADAIGDLAGGISNLTGADDEMIQSGANMLLTFGNIKNVVGEGNDIFDQATAAALDMSVVMGTDMQGAAVQLGKALNDPIKGVTALSKAGVSFSQQQKDQIRTMVEAGDTLGAQKIILGEMEKQFGGAAEAAATPMQRLQTVVGNLQEDLGAYFMPVIETVATWLGDKLPVAFETAAGWFDTLKLGVGGLIGAFQNGDVTSDGFVGVMERIGVVVRDVWPTIQELAGTVKDGLVTAFNILKPIAISAFEGLRDAIGWVIDNFNTLKPIIITAAAGLVAYKVIVTGIKIAQIAWTAATIAWTVATNLGAVAQWALNAALSANPIGLVVIAITALVAAVVLAYNNIDWFREGVQAAWSGIQTAAQFAWNNVLKPIFDVIWWYIETILIPYYTMLWNIAVAVFQGIAAVVTWAWNTVIKPIWDAIYGFIVTYLIPYWQMLWNIAVTVWNGVSSAVSTAWNSYIRPAFDNIKSGISTVISIFGTIKDGVSSAFSTIYDLITNPFRQAFSMVKSLWNNTLGGKGFDIPDWVPGIGGKSFRFPTLHTGGVFQAPTPGGEGLAMLRDGERVLTPQQMAPMESRSSSSSQVVNIEVVVHGSVLAEEDLAETVRSVFIRKARQTPGAYLPGVLA